MARDFITIAALAAFVLTFWYFAIVGMMATFSDARPVACYGLSAAECGVAVAGGR